LGLFGLLVIVRTVLYIAVPAITLPRRYIHAADLFASVFFVALPIVALYAGANFGWNWKRSLSATVAGFGIQAAFSLLSSHAHSALLGNTLFSVSQAGLIIWCLGLGAFIATILKDSNLLLPLSVFLALFDFWLVFCPEGPVGQIARQSGKTVLPSIAYRVPTMVHAPPGAPIQALAYVGPADFMFLAMFFVALYRFKMRTRATFIAIIPVLVLYMLAVLLLGNVTIGPVSLAAMPALLPIGIVVLATNWREFHLTKDERVSTAVLTVAGLALVSWRMSLHWHDSELPVGPSNQAPAQSAPALPESHGSGAPGRSSAPLLRV
jgi:hypothetical protein